MMYNTYNMGIGMVIAVDAADADKAVKSVALSSEKAFIIGEITDGDKGITII